MRISDWSSDVCSSDLTTRPARSALIGLPQLHNCDHERDGCDRQLSCFICCQITSPPLSERICEGPLSQSLALARWGLYNRSEEHTSQLQSLMRISYAVFCLTTKKYNENTPISYHH